MEYWVAYFLTQTSREEAPVTVPCAEAHKFPAPPSREDIHDFEKKVSERLNGEAAELAAMILSRKLTGTEPNNPKLDRIIKGCGIEVKVFTWTLLREE